MARTQLYCYDMRDGTHKVRWKEYDDIYTACLTLPKDCDLKAVPLDGVQGELIPRKAWQVTLDPTWTVFEGDLSDERYFFKPSWDYRYYLPDMNCITPAEQTTKEINMLELIRLHPHPNIMEYHGVVVEAGIVTGTVLTKLVHTLANGSWHVQATSEIVNNVIEQIASGLRHLHALGYMHGDIQRSNIMLDKNGVAVIIDFDSAFKFGDQRHGKISMYLDIDYEEVTIDDTGHFEGKPRLASPEIDFEYLAKVRGELQRQ